MNAQENLWIDVGPLADIPVPGARQLRTENGNIAVVRTSSGGIHAIGDKCPHKGGPLSQGMVFGERLQCPMHGLVIDLISGAAVAPDQGAVPVYPVRIEGGRILVNLIAATPARACSGACACAAA